MTDLRRSNATQNATSRIGPSDTSRRDGDGVPRERKGLSEPVGYMHNYPRRSRAIYRRAMTGRSRKAAMDAFCIMCMGYQPYLVAECTDPDCPLFPYREFKPKEKEGSRES